MSELFLCYAGGVRFVCGVVSTVITDKQREKLFAPKYNDGVIGTAAPKQTYNWNLASRPAPKPARRTQEAETRPQS
eukprot:3803145-Amphidinium_carterae.1